MKIYIIAVEKTDPSRSYDDLGEKLSKHEALKENPCHVLESLWCVRSEKDVKFMEHLVGKLIDVNDKFVIAEVDNNWIARNTKSKHDCFDLND